VQTLIRYPQMVVRLLFALLLAITSIAAAEKPLPEEEVLAWFPLSVGNRWLYRNTETTRANPSGKRTTAVWTHEERVTEHRRTPHGLLVIIADRDVNLSGGPAPRQFHHDYLISGHDVFEIDEAQWLPDKSGLRPRNAADESPLFRFPLRTGSKWGEPEARRDDTMYAWFVDSRHGKTYRLVYMTMPDRTDVWFARGVGVIRKEYTHHGTLDDMTSRLVRFTPAASRPK
jgi:hypothetical protein